MLVVIADGAHRRLADATDSDAAGSRYYADAGNRHKEQIAFLLIGLAGLCFLQFLGSVRGALARAEGEPSRITTAAISSGARSSPSQSRARRRDRQLLARHTRRVGERLHRRSDSARTLADLSYLLFVISLFPAAGMALAVATVAFQFRAFPAWLAWFSVLATARRPARRLFFPSLVVLAWIVALSVYLLIAANRPAPAAAT